MSGESPFSEASGPYSNIVDIPDKFHSQFSGGYFENCLVCDRNLLENHVHYLIEKAIKRFPEYGTEEVIFEYGICIPCLMSMRKRLSEVSKQRVEDYFAAHVDLNERRRQLRENSFDLDKLLDHCIVKNTDASQLTEYQIYAFCRGKKMIISEMPYLIGGEAIDELAQRLSNETLDEIDGFTDKYFGFPPEFRDIFDRNRTLVII